MVRKNAAPGSGGWDRQSALVEGDVKVHKREPPIFQAARAAREHSLYHAHVRPAGQIPIHVLKRSVEVAWISPVAFTLLRGGSWQVLESIEGIDDFLRGTR
jgi:hypothetical protein